MKKDSPSDAELIEAFVASFPILGCDDMVLLAETPALRQLAIDEQDEFGFTPWRPLHQVTPEAALASLEALLPAPLPPLYRRLMRTYRWAEVDLGTFRLLANPPGPDLSLLANEILQDKGLSAFLLANGLIQFGKGPDVNYDPVCFDTHRPNGGGDYRVMQLDHEEILCHKRIREVPFGSLYGGSGQPAPNSFRELMQDVIGRAM